MVKILVYETTTFQLYVEKSQREGLVSVSIKSLWPQARTEKDLHTLFQINLPKEAMDRLADAIKGGV